MKKLRCGRGVTLMLRMITALSFATGSSGAWAKEPRVSAVFTLDNEKAGNSVLAFAPSPDGTLGKAKYFSTGGTGTGTGLGSQGALALAQQGRYLLAVNPGSDELSALALDEDGDELRLVSKIHSGGSNPISVTSHDSLVYVLNAGAPANITGFWLKRGQLVAIPGSTRHLSTANPAPAEVSFSPFGDTLVVTEKATNKILTFNLRLDGRTGEATVHSSNGQTPFGFDFTEEGLLVVSEAANGSPNASTVSSYLSFSTPWRSFFRSLSMSVPDHQTAACWTVATPKGEYAYTSNTGSGTISGYALQGGRLTLLVPDGKSGVTGDGSKPTDMAIASRHLYVLNSGTHVLATFQIGRDGGLTPVGAPGLLPPNAAGLVAR